MPNQLSFSSKILDLENAVTRLDQWKTNGDVVVFTNGCFDILHAGHLTYLDQAKALGDKLVIGLNTDASVKTNKGDLRPVIPESSRALMLAALDIVDMVVLFDQKTPEALISQLKPSIHTKGGDYKPDDLPETKIVKGYGGEVKILPFVDGFSTTSIIEKIRDAYL